MSDFTEFFMSETNLGCWYMPQQLHSCTYNFSACFFQPSGSVVDLVVDFVVQNLWILRIHAFSIVAKIYIFLLTYSVFAFSNTGIFNAPIRRFIVRNTTNVIAALHQRQSSLTAKSVLMQLLQKVACS